MIPVDALLVRLDAPARRRRDSSGNGTVPGDWQELARPGRPAESPGWRRWPASWSAATRCWPAGAGRICTPTGTTAPAAPGPWPAPRCSAPSRRPVGGGLLRCPRCRAHFDVRQAGACLEDTEPAPRSAAPAGPGRRDVRGRAGNSSQDAWQVMPAPTSGQPVRPAPLPSPAPADRRAAGRPAGRRALRDVRRAHPRARTSTSWTSRATP